MKLLIWLGLAALFTACAAGDGADEPTIVGTWGLDEGGCATVFAFRKDRTYSQLFLCQSLTGPELLAQREDGRYETTEAGNVIVCPEASSCPDADPGCAEVAYELNAAGDELQFSGRGGVAFLVRIEEDDNSSDSASGSGQVRYGCFVDDAGNFEFGPVEEL